MSPLPDRLLLLPLWPPLPEISVGIPLALALAPIPEVDILAPESDSEDRGEIEPGEPEYQVILVVMIKFANS